MTATFLAHHCLVALVDLWLPGNLDDTGAVAWQQAAGHYALHKIMVLDTEPSRLPSNYVAYIAQLISGKYTN